MDRASEAFIARYYALCRTDAGADIARKLAPMQQIRRAYAAAVWSRQQNLTSAELFQEECRRLNRRLDPIDLFLQRYRALARLLANIRIESVEVLNSPSPGHRELGMELEAHLLNAGAWFEETARSVEIAVDSAFLRRIERTMAAAEGCLQRFFRPPTFPRPEAGRPQGTGVDLAARAVSSLTQLENIAVNSSLPVETHLYLRDQRQTVINLINAHRAADALWYVERLHTWLEGDLRESRPEIEMREDLDQALEINKNAFAALFRPPPKETPDSRPAGQEQDSAAAQSADAEGEPAEKEKSTKQPHRRRRKSGNGGKPS